MSFESANEVPPIIETHALTRDFKKTRAVDSLDLSIRPGELFGLVGPDGAGKTTTLRLLAGLLNITSGSAKVAGYDLARQPEAIKRKIGYMAQQFNLYGELSVLENLSFFADLYDVEVSELRERTERLLAFAGLTEFKDRRAAQLSGGMQKKLALACTLIHQPEILLLDEPTTGVDPISRRRFLLSIQKTRHLISIGCEVDFVAEGEALTPIEVKYTSMDSPRIPPTFARSSGDTAPPGRL